MAEKKSRTISVIVKEPYKEPRRLLITNTLATLQGLVGGYIEHYQLCTDLVIICNEEGRIRNLPFNTSIANLDFYGTIVLVGLDGEEYTSCPNVEWMI